MGPKKKKPKNQIPSAMMFLKHMVTPLDHGASVPQSIVYHDSSLIVIPSMKIYPGGKLAM